MPKRKKYPKLPSGWGSIRYLGAGRRNPYAVHPPCTEVNEKGDYVRPKALCYVSDWYVGFAVLNAYRAGTYRPGDELSLAAGARTEDAEDIECLVDRILRDYGQWHGSGEEKPREPTFAEVYEQFYEWKFGENAPKKLSESRKYVVRAAYQNLAPLHARAFRELRVDDLQAVINACPLARGSLDKMRGLLVEMYSYAEARELCDRDYSRHLIIPSGAKEDEHGVPLTEGDILKLWKDREDPVSAALVIMCYTGFRISEYAGLSIDLSSWSMTGGLKTDAGKGRTVPVHPCIREVLAGLLAGQGKVIPSSVQVFRGRMASKLASLGIAGEHTPHDCRHTFSALCERYGVSDADRKRMMGHAFGSDITNGVYGHRTLEDLMAEIVKIPAPEGLRGSCPSVTSNP